jgi:hypothetical protein
MAIRKLKEYKKDYMWGKIFLLKSEKFGINLFLCCKNPAKSDNDKNKFVDLMSKCNDIFHYSSVMDDEVLKVYYLIDIITAMKDYYKFRKK